MDPKLATLHGPRVFSAVIPLSRLFHYVGFSLAIGSALAVALVRRSAARTDGAGRDALDRIAADLIAGVELPGLFVAFFGGLLAVVANPPVLDPSGPYGPWLHIKLLLVIVLIAAALVNAFQSRLLVREREHGAKEAELAKLSARGAKLDVATLALAGVILVLATFRLALFG